MLKKFLLRVLAGACLLAILTSCGSKAAGTGEFATVFAVATGPASDLDADVVTSWLDASNNSGTACAVGNSPVSTATQATYNVTSTPYNAPNTGTTNPTVASPLVITRITVVLTPANTSTPALPAEFQTQYPTAGQLIQPGATVPITITLAPKKLNEFLAMDVLLPNGTTGLICSSNVLSYRASVSFEALEVNTNRVSTITAPGYLVVNFADFV